MRVQCRQVLWAELCVAQIGPEATKFVAREQQHALAWAALAPRAKLAIAAAHICCCVFARRSANHCDSLQVSGHRRLAVN